MAVTKKSFEVKLDNERAEIAFGLRIAITDYIRQRFKQKLAAAEDAGVDKVTAIQRFSLAYAGAARGFKLPRAIAPQLIQWAGYVEYNARMNWFPACPSGTVGTFDQEAASMLPGDVCLIKMGGVNFAGICEGGLPGDITEVRVGIEDGKYTATIVAGKPDDGSDTRVPVPEAPETQDA